MGWGFRRRAGLFGGLLRLNFSKHGLGASAGVPGLRVGINSLHGGYIRGGVPGTGPSFSEHVPSHLPQKKAPRRHVSFLAILACVLFIVFWIAAVWIFTFPPAR
jgi:hypothetical protein